MLLRFLFRWLALLAVSCPPKASATAVQGVRTGGARPEPMKPRDRVIVLSDPLSWGAGRVLTVEKDGRLKCEFDHPDPDNDGSVVELFDPFELELYDVWAKAEKASLTQRDLRRLRQSDSRNR